MVEIRAVCKLAYSSRNSHPRYDLLFFLATIAVVPDPMNGSKTISPFSLPARIHGVTNSSGYVAKCAPLYGFTVTDQTDRLFFVE